MGNLLDAEKKTFVFIEGNIGSGKSSLLHWLQTEHQFDVLTEDVDNWKFLEHRYKDPERWAMTFQLEVFMSMVRNLEKKLRDGNDIVFVERSLDACEQFSKLAFDRSYMTADEFKLLSDLMKRSRDKMTASCTVRRVYIDCPIDTCHRRIKNRSRASVESSITEPYLKVLEQSFKEIRQKSIVIDGTLPIHEAGRQLLVALEE